MGKNIGKKNIAIYKLFSYIRIFKNGEGRCQQLIN
jgi:hypothetical protein